MRRHLWWALGLVLVLGGGAVALATQTGAEDFGWFAYSPSGSDPDWYTGSADLMVDGSAVIVSRGQLAGGAILVLGLTVLAAGAGFRLGRRRVEPRRNSRGGADPAR